MKQAEPKNQTRSPVNFDLLFSTISGPEYSATVATVKEVGEQAESIRKLTDAIAEMERPFVPTFLAS